MSVFRRKTGGEMDWREKAGALLRSVTNFLVEVQRKRGKQKMSVGEYIVERKLVFLVDDLRQAIKENNPSGIPELIGEINQCWFELYEEVSKRK